MEYAVGQRYKTIQFDSLDIDSMTYRTLNSGRKLKLDLIQPTNDSIKEARPLIIFMHGGGFQQGIRNKEDVLQFCKEWAKRGYVVATITYRLTLKGKSFHCDLPKKEKINTFKEAALDLHRATNFLLERHKEFNFNKKYVVLAGNSAGAEAILYGAFFKEEQLIEPILPTNFSYAGVLSYAGAISDTSVITKRNAIPIGLFHGTCDQWVPFGTDTHHFCPEETPGALLLHGSYSIMKRLKTLKRPYYLHSVCGADHGINKQSLIYQLEDAVDFIYESVIRRQFVQRHYIDKSNERKCKFGRYDFCK